MLQAGKTTEIAKVLITHNLDLIGLQEMRWAGSGYITEKEYKIYYSGAEKQGHFGTGFIISNRLVHSILGFQDINKRLCKLRVKGKLYNTTFLCAHAPTEDADEEDKENFYIDLSEACEKVPKYDQLIILGDFNAQIGKEDAYAEVIGKHSLHNLTSDNGEKLCYFAASHDLFIASTKFPHKNIHKATWRVPGKNLFNQIDHVLISRRRLTNVQDVRTYRGANCDSDHFLVVATLKLKISRMQINRGERKIKWDTDKLKVASICTTYKNEVTQQLQGCLPDQDINKEWDNIKQAIVNSAKTVIGTRQKCSKEKWYDQECEELLHTKNEARLKMLQNNTEVNRHLYRTARNISRKVTRKKKRTLENNRVLELEHMRDKTKIRHFYKRVNEFRKGYQPRTCICKDSAGDMLINKPDIIHRWKEHFQQLLNIELDSAEDSALLTYYDVEEELPQPTFEEVHNCIKYLKNNKAPGMDTITAELLKQGGPALEERLYLLIIKIWQCEEMPQDWQLGIITPIFKKGDKTVCANYRGITILPTAYKVFSAILYWRLTQYSEDILGEYQCGFRPNRSTTDQIHLMRQTLEKTYEYDINLHHMFIDFKQAFDSVKRRSILDSMLLLGIPSKLVRLTEATLRNSRSSVAIQNDLSEPFHIQSGVKQGDALSTIIFNLVLEATTRVLNLNGLIDCNTSQMAAYADDIVITSQTQSSMTKHTTNLAREAAKFGLQINISKTQYLATSRKNSSPKNVMVNGNVVEGVSTFKYLGSNLNNSNSMEEEIKARITSGSKCFYACKKMLSSKLLTTQSKLVIYKTIIRPVVTYACETWTLTQKDEQKLAIFERKVLRKIFGPLRDKDGDFRVRMNHELDNLIHKESIVRFIKAQRLRWAGHLERMNNKRAVKVLSDWTPTRKRPRGRPRKTWQKCVEEDLKKIGKLETWKTEAQDRLRWKKIVEEAKTHTGL